jgi:hypothetical protein
MVNSPLFNENCQLENRAIAGSLAPLGRRVQGALLTRSLVFRHTQVKSACIAFDAFSLPLQFGAIWSEVPTGVCYNAIDKPVRAYLLCANPAQRRCTWQSLVYSH